MNDSIPTTEEKLLEDISVFFAHSVTLELEAAERLYELAETMKVHNNRPLVNLFLELARFSDLHGKEVESLCQELKVPDLRAWDYHWPGEESPESFGYDGIHYLMSPQEALETALKVEMSAEKFYRDIARNTSNDQIRHYATFFADEELMHVAAVQKKLSDLKPEIKDQELPQEGCIDLDPPNSPE